MRTKNTLLVRSFVVGGLGTNCYIVSDTVSKDALIIDPGDEGGFIAEELVRMKVQPKAILLTHGHFDHVLGAFELQTIFALPVFMNSKDSFLIQRMRETAEHYLGRSVIEPSPTTMPLSSKRINVGSISIICHETPGHTPGSVSYEIKNGAHLFTGDTLFAHGVVGGVDHAYSSRKDLATSVKKLLLLSEVYTIHPGHGEESIMQEEQIIWKHMSHI